MPNRILTIPALRATAGVVALVWWCLVLGTPAGATQTPQQRCQAGKNRAAGKYAACLQSAEAKLVANGDMAKYNTAVTNCQTRFANKWQKLIDRAAAAGATCPDAPLTGAQLKTVIDEH